MSRIPLFLAGFACIAVGTFVPWTEFGSNGIYIAGIKVDVAYYTALFIAATGSLAVTKYVIEIFFGACTSDRYLIALFFFAFGITGVSTWYGFVLKGELVAHEYRSTAQALALLIGSMCITAGVTFKKTGWIDRLLDSAAIFPRKFLLLMCGVVLLAGGTIAFYILDAMPHMSDALTYLMQGRVYWSGHLATEVPLKPHLLTGGGGFFFREGPQGFFGKYPPGWPFVLGLFDLFNAAWLAAPVSACGILWVVYSLAKRIYGLHSACIATFLLATCPWLWFNTATQMSHILTTFLLWGFLDRFTAMQSSKPYLNAWAAGMFLGASITTRPQDALFFAAPVIIFSAWSLIRWNRRVALPSLLVAASALPGLWIYLALNRYYMSGSGTSPYGDSLISTLFYNPPTSPVQWLSWVQECAVLINQLAYVGAVPVLSFVAVSMVICRKRLYKLWLPLACTSSFCICYSFVILQSRPWVGPRFLVPILPMIAILVAIGLEALKERCSVKNKESLIPQFFFNLFVVSFVIGLTVATPACLLKLRQQPPHAVDGRVTAAVAKLDLQNAIIGMDFPPAQLSWKDPRAGMAGMTMPLRECNVIFVKIQANWIQDSNATWPGRDIYIMDPAPDNYTIRVAIE